MLKSILVTMVSFYIFVFWLGMPIAEYIFPWGSPAESYFKPIYFGMVVLSGLIVGCTCYIAELIKEQRLDKKINVEEKH